MKIKGISNMINYKKNIELFSAPTRESAVDIVINTIKKLIMEKELLPGSRLPSELELSKGLSISRGIIREAMKILSAYGLVEIKRGDGTYIASSINETMFEPLLFNLILINANSKEMLELRSLMEFEIIRLIIKNAGQEELDKLKEAFLRMENLVKNGEKDIQLLVRGDIEFHLAMGYATKNRLVEKIYKFILEFFYPSIQKAKIKEADSFIALKLHKNILDSLMSKDLERSIAAVKESIDHWNSLF